MWVVKFKLPCYKVNHVNEVFNIGSDTIITINIINNIQIKKLQPHLKKKKVSKDEQLPLCKDYKINKHGVNLNQKKKKAVTIVKRKFMGISGRQMNLVSIYKQNLEINQKK